MIHDPAIRAAKETLRKHRQSLKAARPRAFPVANGQRQPRAFEPLYLAWLRTLPCVACMIEGPPPAGIGQNPIEAAHQKLAIASAGWKEGGGGVRTHDRRCVGLCRWHHQHAPNACDKGQRRFWDRLGLGDGIATLCSDLHAAFLSGSDGAAVIQKASKP